jgi:hypothetical protein
MSKRFLYAVLILVISALISLLPVFWIQANRIFSLDKDVVFHHFEKCKRQEVEASILDMVELDDDELLAVENDLNSLFANGPDETSQGRLLRIIDVAFGSPKFKPVEIRDFPKDVAFRPFGLFYENSKIYVLNQAFHMGGSRIEFFDYKDGQAFYKGSTFLDQAIGGTFGDLIVNKGFAYLNQYSQVPFQQSNNPLPLKSILKQFYNDFAQVHQAGVYRCQLILNGTTECDLMKTSKSASVTSLVKEDDENVWVAFSSVDYNWVERYEIDNKGNLNFLEKIALRDQAGRLFYSKSNHRVYAAALPWPFMMMTSNYVPGGVVEIRKLMWQKSFTHRRLFMQENLIKGITAAARVGNYALGSTFIEKAVLVCLIVDP